MFSIICLILGAVCLYVGISALRIHSKNKKRDFVETQGTVAELTQRESKIGMIPVQILHYDVDNVGYKVEASIKKMQLEVGDVVELLVDREEPEYVLVNDGSKEKPMMTGTILCVVGVALSIAGLFIA